MTGAERLAQPGLKASLKALGDGLLHPTGHPRGDEGTAALPLQPLAGLYSRGAVADFLSELSRWVTSRADLPPITGTCEGQKANSAVLLHYSKGANAALLRACAAGVCFNTLLG